MSEVFLSADLLDNLMIEELLRPVLETGIGFTNCEEEIRARNVNIQLLSENPSLQSICRTLCLKYADLEQITRLNSPDTKQIFSVLPLLDELYRAMENFSKIVSEASALSSNANLSQLQNEFNAIRQNEFQPDFLEKWKNMLSGLQDIHSLTYRFVFNDDLEITRYCLLTVEDQAYTKRGLLSKIDPHQNHDMNFLARNMDAYKNQYFAHESYAMTPGAAAPSTGALRQASSLFEKEVRDNRLANIQTVLMTTIPTLYSRQDQELWNAVRSLGTRILRKLESAYRSIHFWLRALELMEKIRQLDLPLAYPHILPASDHACHITGAYHPAVAMHLERPSEIICNDISFDDKQQFLLITGANGGGKTTYLRTVGVQQLFFQLGLPLPAKDAQISPVDSIVCAFSLKEDTHLSSGKLGQELIVIQQAIQSISGRALVLFNEPITGTSVGECCLISREILAIMTLLEIRGIWVTHLYSLLDDVSDINDMLQGNPIGYLHLDDQFHVKPGRGENLSHARAVFEKEVLGFSQAEAQALDT